MEDKLEEIIRQYPCQVRSRRRTRGAFLLETPPFEGMFRQSGKD